MERPLPPTTGGRLRRYREAHGLSREALGVAVGRSTSTVSRWELDEVTPSLAMLRRLASVVGASTGELIPSDDEAPLSVAS